MLRMSFQLQVYHHWHDMDSGYDCVMLIKSLFIC